MENYKKVLFQAVALIVGLYFFFLAVVEAKPFLAPLVMALILALVMMPVSNKLEKWGMGRVYASLACTIMLLLLSIGFAALISLQLSEFLSDFDKVQQRIMPLVKDAEQMVYSNTPLSDGDIKSQDAMSAKSIGTRALSFLNSFYSFLGDFLLTFIYIFFMLNYRSKFRKFIIKLFDSAKREKISKVLTEAAELTQGYLFGKFILIVFLAVLYGVGMGLTGVSNFIVISIIAALLTIIPYIGNIVGFVLAILDILQTATRQRLSELLQPLPQANL